MRRFLIVGGSRGIGAALARHLAAEGHEMFVISRDPWDLPAFYERAAADVVTDDLPDWSEPFDGLAYCPGSITLKTFHRLREQDFQSDFERNALGATRVLQKYRRNLRAAGSASVVLFSSVAARLGMSNHASIAMAKGAVEGLTRALAAEWAPNIRVNAIAPSLTETELAGSLLASPELCAAAAKRHPMGRIGTPEDIAATAAFCLSPESGFMTGQILSTDGGMAHLRRF